MAVAGKVAITLSTENGGAWSADVTYDRLVAVKHNNNLYISRKTVANVEPPNNEFWFLALEGFGGDDVQALIDQINALSDLIQAIIDGTQQVGNAKTLDGNNVDVFAKATDLSNYFPKSGGQITSTRNDPLQIDTTGTADYNVLRFMKNGALMGFLGFDENGACAVVNGSFRTLLHTGNKPTGTYTGNGDATERNINIGGIGDSLVVYGGGRMAVITPWGAIVQSEGNVIGMKNEQLGFYLGNLKIATTSYVNENGVTYTYQVL